MTAQQLFGQAHQRPTRSDLFSGTFDGCWRFAPTTVVFAALSTAASYGRVQPLTSVGVQKMGTASPTFNLISSENVEGTNVYDPNGNKIGSIDHLMIDRVSGHVRYVVMSFGGFMGLGHSHYPLPWNAIKYEPARAGYITNVTENQLKDAPEFSDKNWM